MGGVDTKNRFHVHWGPPEQYAERREESALRRSGRPVPDRVFDAWLPIDLGPLETHPGRQRLRPAPAADDPRGDTGAVRLPAGRGAPAHQPLDRRLVQRDLRHRHFVSEPRLRAGPRLGDRPVPVRRRARCSAAAASATRSSTALGTDIGGVTADGAVRFVAADCGGESRDEPLVTLDGQPQPGMTADKAAIAGRERCAPRRARPARA